MGEGIRIGGGNAGGKYAWKKYKNPAMTNVNITINGSTLTGGTVTCDSIDLSTVDASFFDGFTRDDNVVVFEYANGVLNYVVNSTTYYEAVWEASTQKMFLPSIDDAWVNSGFSKEIFTYDSLKIVTDNDFNKYPDGAFHTDGYYYVRANCGWNVWRKYEYTPAVTVENPQCHFDGLYGTNIITISNENFDLTKIENWQDFFNGFKGKDSSGLNSCSISGTTFQSGAYSSPIRAFDPVNKKFTLRAAIKTGTNADCSYTGTKNYSDEKKTLSTFAVDDDPSAYPNGAVHTDGYYYELLGSISSANVMSLSDNAVATVQQDYRNTIETEVSNANS